MALIGIALVSAACSSQPSPAEPVIDEEPAAHAGTTRLSLEEAGFLAAGALVEIYGTRADPVPAEVDASGVVYQGQEMWRLDVTVQVTLGGRRTERVWRMWVGTLADGQAGVVRAQERPR